MGCGTPRAATAPAGRVALLDLRDLAERDVPRWLRELGQLRRILVEVDVGVDDEQVLEPLARPAGRFAHGHGEKII
jgi:hypothetical protein